MSFAPSIKSAQQSQSDLLSVNDQFVYSCIFEEIKLPTITGCDAPVCLETGIDTRRKNGQISVDDNSLKEVNIRKVDEERLDINNERNQGAEQDKLKSSKEDTSFNQFLVNLDSPEPINEQYQYSDSMEIMETAKKLFYDKDAERAEVAIVGAYVRSETNVQEAVGQMNEMIDTWRQHASGYVNRAELFKEIIILNENKKENGESQGCLVGYLGEEEERLLMRVENDLTTAIKLAEGYLTSQEIELEHLTSNRNQKQDSCGIDNYQSNCSFGRLKLVRSRLSLRMIEKAKTLLGQAYTQQGWMKLRQIKQINYLLAQKAAKLTDEPKKLQKEKVRFDAVRWDLEKDASESLRLGGVYGNAQAQAAAVRINPFAKLCGQMVQRAMKEELEYR